MIKPRLMRSISPPALIAMGVWIVTIFGVAAEQLTYVDLIHRLTDLEHLATLPTPGEKTAQLSSYDRASKYDASTGKYLAWDANNDGNGIVREEGGLQVLAEMEGPGCIWRIWSAAPKEGHVRIYLDGASEPAVDLPFSGYFNGQNEPFTRAALVHETARGWNNYTPIPYQKSCRIVAEPGWGMYYHFGYTTFAKGTEVATFKRELSDAEKSALDEADKLLSLGGAVPEGSRQGEVSNTRNVRLSGGKSVSVANLKGPRAITAIRVKTDQLEEAEDRNAMRELAIQINWDGEISPSVWSPLGDFFGTAPGSNKYRSLPLGQTDSGWWYCYWFMPFASNAVIRLHNDGANARNASIEVVHAPLLRLVSEYGRFHAKWHRNEFLPTVIERQIDWPVLKTEGRGRFVGMALHIWNPRGGWWGEGDEKFFVDGEPFPSTFGTGSEDYFGYAWGDPARFQNAYHNQTHNDGNNKGHISVNRWHISDQVPFQKSFEADIEKYFPDGRPTQYAAMAYWYLDVAGHDPYSAVPVEQRTSYYVQPETHKVAGAVEAELLKVLTKTGGNVRPQEMSGFGDAWSNDAQLWWTDAKPGDRLELALTVPATGRFGLSAQFTKAADYGIVQLKLDDQKLGEPLDFYHDGVIATGELNLGEHELTEGEHEITVEIIGANEKAAKAYMFGLDYLKLVPAP